MAVTSRTAAKAERRAQILDAAAELFARKGYANVSLDAIGERVGISGPGVYRHFGSKQEILSELLVGISERLLSGSQSIRQAVAKPEEALSWLIDFHVDFALHHANIIRVHDRDFGSLSPETRREVRETQRAYVKQWEKALACVHPDLQGDDLTTRTFGVIGLINSTAYSRRPDGENLGRIDVILNSMAHSALNAERPNGMPAPEVTRIRFEELRASIQPAPQTTTPTERPTP